MGMVETMRLAVAQSLAVLLLQLVECRSLQLFLAEGGAVGAAVQWKWSGD